MADADVRELLALLCTRQQSYEAGHGGIPTLTAVDIALALGIMAESSSYPESLPNLAALIGRLKYSEDERCAKRLAELVARHVVRTTRDPISIPSVPHGEFLKELAMVAIAEWSDKHICPWCNGTKDRVLDSKKVICSACGGTGIRLPTDKERERLIGVPWEPWAKVYGEMLDALSRAEHLLKGALKRLLRQTEEA